jgi:hypothetical protein
LEIDSNCEAFKYLLVEINISGYVRKRKRKKDETGVWKFILDFQDNHVRMKLKKKGEKSCQLKRKKLFCGHKRG